MVLLVWQRDLGAASLFFILFLSLLYIATGQKSYLFGGLILLGLASAFAYFAFGDVVAPRVNTWLNPWPLASNEGYQVVQSLYALGAGKFIGQGIGQGFPDYIPVVHSDFAFAAIGEEWGLLGALAVVVCFAVLAERGIRTALAAIGGHPPRHFYSYLATGITVMIASQSLLIMSGVTKLLPLTGVTLPFVSYGGSSLLISFLLVGLLLYLSAEAESGT
jgi:cell division protein FtsW (lipid II flippase)